MNIPEVTLKKLIDILLKKVIDNYNSKEDKTTTFLHRIFDGNSIEGYDYFTQAKALLLRNDGDTRKIETRIFFDRSRASMPTIHITLPSESPYGDGIGFDQGYSEPIFTEDTFNEQKTRGSRTKYQIIVTSDNTFEVLIIYYLLKALFISNSELIELNGLRDAKMFGQDLLIRDESMPQNVFMRALILDCFYEISVPHMEDTEMLQNIDFEPTVFEQVDEMFRVEGEVTFLYANKNVFTS